MAVGPGLGYVTRVKKKHCDSGSKAWDRHTFLTDLELLKEIRTRVAPGQFLFAAM